MKLTCNSILLKGAMFLVINVLIISSLISQSNSVCPIGVGMDPSMQVNTKATSLVNEIYSPNFAKWQNLQQVKFSDDKKSSISLADFNRSRILMGNNMRFQLPEGAMVHGIVLSIEGQSDHYQNISELEISLLGPEGTPVGQNKANTAKLQKPWSAATDGSDRMWMYGSSTDTWGTDWRYEDINNDNFGFQIQLRNIDTDTINVLIDRIDITVYYSPAYSFCDAKCLTFYIDKYEQKGSYVWQVPEGFDMVSGSSSFQTIDLKITDADYGLHTICVDVFEKSGAYSETCCRDFLYQDCTSSEVKGLVWLDLNDNKVRDTGEGIISSVPVVLYDSSGVIVDTVLSDTYGVYHFTGLPESKYYIKTPNIADKLMVLDTGADPDLNSDITNAFGVGTTNLFQTEIGRCVEGIDLGYTPLVSLGDFVWLDQNFNGLQDINEKGLANFKVYLYDGTNVLRDSTRTDASGHYVFDSLAANRYYLKFDIPQDYIPTFRNLTNSTKNSKISSSGITSTSNYTTSGLKSDLDAGFYQWAKVGDYVWEDKNGDGIQNTNEATLPNIAVQLIGTSGDGLPVSLSTLTDINGKYSFTKLKPGVYTIVFTAPALYYFTLAGEGDDNQKDSNPIDGEIANLTVSSGDLLWGLDAGLYRYGSIGDFVWDDLNGNGLQDSNEIGVPNVKVTLYELLRDERLLISSIFTNLEGYYAFDNLKPGFYAIEFEFPSGYFSTFTNQGADDSIDSDAVNGQILTLSLMSGEMNTTYDAGIFKTSSIGNFVWEDANANGIQDAGESGIAEVEVSLTGLTGNGQSVSTSTKTDAQGKYVFSDLAPGVYSLMFTAPNGFNFTIPNIGTDDNLDSDVVGGMVANITVQGGSTLLHLDAGLYKLSSIGDFVWEDANFNGIQDIGEAGIANVKITLQGTTGAGGIISMTTTTDSNGKYLFAGILPGMYELLFTSPAGFELTAINRGVNNALDSDVQDGLVSNITLTSGMSISSLDAGYYRYASIGDFVWQDLNADGVQDSTEPGLLGVTISLSGINGIGQNINLSTTTDSNGRYHFDGLQPGNYMLTFVAADAFISSPSKQGSDDNKDSDVMGGIIDNINLQSGFNITNLDAGYYQSTSLGDFVWEDVNANGVQDPNEVGFANVTVTLTGIVANGQTINAQTTTDGNGFYAFENLIPGTYSLAFELPIGYLFTIPNIGGNEDQDSDVVNGSIANIVLMSGETLTNLDGGIFTLGSLGDFVWHDMNGNGFQDTGEPGIPNVDIKLTGVSGFGVQVSRMTVTDSGGKYIFEGLIPGLYTIEVVAPEDYLFILPHLSSDDTKDSNADFGFIRDIQLLSGQDNITLDAGLYKGGMIGDFVWLDANANGVQDSNEVGIPNVTVRLEGIVGFGNNTEDIVKTDQNGKFLFEKLIPGHYNISVDAPIGFVLTAYKQGSNTDIDSDLLNGMMSNIVVESGSVNLDLDAGFYQFGSISDVVWVDINANGIRDANENGIPNVTVQLSGITGDGQPVSQSIQTDASGAYLFDNLVPGEYSITFTPPNTYMFTNANVGNDDTKDSDAVNGEVSNIIVTTGLNVRNISAGLFQNATIGDFVWLDTNANGLQDMGEMGITNVTVNLTGLDGFGNSITQSTITSSDGLYLFADLTPGTYAMSFMVPNGFVATSIMVGSNTGLDSNVGSNGIANIVLNSGDEDLSLDAGYINGISIGDFVWEDKNTDGIQNANESGIPNIKISLQGTSFDGMTINEITNTDANGSYRFTNVFPGTYTISVDIPTGYSPTRAQVGTDDSVDSNLSENSNTYSFTLSNNQSDLTIDFGLVRLGSIGDLVWEDKNCNGIREPGEPGISGVTVTLDGIDLFGAFVNESLQTDAQGNYLFDNLKPGSYTINFGLVSGFEFSIAMITMVDVFSGENILNIDAPLFRRASIGDFVWVDTNENGVQDANEMGLSNVKVSLKGDQVSQPTLKEVLTDSEGYYIFTDLKPGKYDLLFDVPTGYIATTAAQGTDTSLDSDIDINGAVNSISVSSGDSNLSIDAGFISTSKASIGNFVWEDMNGNGVQDDNEPGLRGVKVILSQLAPDGSVLLTEKVTDFNGFYIFDGLNTGNYTITFELLDNYIFTNQAVGTDNTKDSDADKSTGITDIITLTQSSNITDIDAGMYRYASIGDYVWQDDNKNGLQDIGEPGLGNVILRLLDANNNTINSATSSDFGFYFFSDIVPGTYSIEAEIPAGFNVTSMVAGSANINSDFSIINGVITTGQFVVNSNSITFDIDLGLTQIQTSQGGYAWYDADGDGIRGLAEVAVDSLPVFLLNMAGDTLAIDSTDTNGFYIFEGLAAGDYKISFGMLDNFLFTLSNQGSDSLLDSDAISPTSGTTVVFAIAEGDERTDISAGYVGYSSIGDYVWIDANENGLQDMDESGLNNIKVRLFDSDGTLIDSTLTGILPVVNTSGYYHFDQLVYGDYYVEFGIPAAFNFTNVVSNMSLINSDVINSTGKTADFILSPGQARTDIDAGYIIVAPITGNIEGRVWMDANNNKLRDASEMSSSGIEVKLYKIDGTLITMQNTASDGTYMFDNIPFGDYYIAGPALTGKITVPYSGMTVPFDSDISNEFGANTTRLLSLFPGETLANIDLGYASIVSIGDFVWEDLNGNGLQDTGEPGLAQVKVELINEQGTIEQTTTSSATGMYNFANVAVGRYSLKFVAPSGLVTTIINNTNQITNNKANEQGIIVLRDFTVVQTYNNMDAGFVKAGRIGDNVWLDLNGNGFLQANEPGIPGVKIKLYTDTGVLKDSTVTGVGPDMIFNGYYQFINVRPGKYYLKFEISSDYIISPPNVVGEDDDSNITDANGPMTTDTFSIAINQTINNIDAGAYLPATIGDRVWNDINMNGAQDAGEPGIEGVLVTLRTQSGLSLGTAITDASGSYSFTGLRQRLYFLQFELLDGYQFTEQNISGNGATDSDVDQTGTTPLISLAHGSTFLDIDAGMHITNASLVMGRVWNDINEDGMRTEDEQLMPLTTVYLEDANLNILATTTTNHAGMYCFATEYTGQTYVAVEAPEDHVFTNKHVGPDPNMDSDVSDEGLSDMLMFDDAYVMTYVDAGFYYKVTASLNGVVWEDKNDNSLKDATDQFLPNVLVLLFNKSKIFVKSTKTDENGVYSLKNLDPGQYYCLVPEYEDKDFILYTGANTDKDSEVTNQYGMGTTRLLTLAGGAPFENFDFGYKKKGTRLTTPGLEALNNQLLISPNPSMWYINVEVPTNEDAQYYIMNSIGAVVQNGVIQGGKTRIDTERLPSGKYSLHVVNSKVKLAKTFMKIENY